MRALVFSRPIHLTGIAVREADTFRHGHDFRSRLLLVRRCATVNNIGSPNPLWDAGSSSFGYGAVSPIVCRARTPRASARTGPLSPSGLR